MAFKYTLGQPFMYPQNDLDYCENFLRMMFAVPSEPYELDPDFVEAYWFDHAVAGIGSQAGVSPSEKPGSYTSGGRFLV